MKRTACALALMFLAVPLAFVGCGDSEKNGGSGGDGGSADGVVTVPDGGPGRLDGAVTDASSALDVAAPDVPLLIDSALVDAGSAIDTVKSIDSGALDAGTIDSSAPVDSGPALDTGAKLGDAAKSDTGTPIDVALDNRRAA